MNENMLCIPTVYVENGNSVVYVVKKFTRLYLI